MGRKASKKKVADVLEPEEVPLPTELSAIIKQLKHAGKSIDKLVTCLDQLSKVLASAPQEPESLGESAQELLDALGSDDIVASSDEEVKLHAALCIVHIFRIWAPNLPFETAKMQILIQLLLWAMGLLSDVKAIGFQISLSVLKSFAEVKGYILLLELANEGLLVDLFKLLGCVNDGNASLVEELLTEVLTGVLEELDSGTLPPQVIELLVSKLILKAKPSNIPAIRIAKHVLQKAEPEVKPFLQAYFANLISSKSKQAGWKDSAAAILHEVHLLCPSVLLPIIPQLIAELHVEDDKRRVDAVHLSVKLLSLSGGDILHDYPDILEQLMKRFQDLSADVRKQALLYTLELLQLLKKEKQQKEVLEAASTRLLDVDERVRIAAVHAAVDVLMAQHSKAGLAKLDMGKILAELVKRLRDKKAHVRKETAAGLGRVWRAWAARSGGVPPSPASPAEITYLQLPGRLLLAMTQGDGDLPQYIGDHVLQNGLLPTEVQGANAAHLWLQLYTHMQEQEQELLMQLLRMKERVQDALRRWLLLRLQAVKGKGDDSRAARLTAAARKLASLVGNIPHAVEQVTRLTEVKDNKVFSGLLSCCNPVADQAGFSATLKDVMQRVGSKGPLAEFLSILCHRAVHNVLAPAHLRALLAELGTASSANAIQILGMLHRMCKAAPSAFVAVVPELPELLASSSVGCSTAASEIIAAAGNIYKDLPDSKAKELAAVALPQLRKLCLQGALKAAKAAPLALNALLQPVEAKKELMGLAVKLMAQLTPKNVAHKSTPAAIQALSSIARVLPDAFEQHVRAYQSFVIDTYLPSSLEKSAAAPLNGTSSHMVGRSMVLKAGALKAVARALLPNNEAVKPSDAAASAAAQLLELLTRLMDPSAEMEGLLGESELDDGHLRLAAAASVLRLARRFETKMLPSAFVACSLTMQDPLAGVRAAFAVKAKRTALYFQARPNAHQLVCKYMSCLALAAVDPKDENTLAATRMLQELVRLRRAAAHHSALARAASASAHEARAASSAPSGSNAAAGTANGTAASSGGSSLPEHPEFLLPYLMYTLAHHPDFPEARYRNDPEMLKPFQAMMQLALEALLAPGPGGQPGGSMPAIVKILRTLKHTEDAMEDGYDPSALYLLCDAALEITRAIARRRHGKKGAAADEEEDYPGHVVLPKAFFKYSGGKGRLIDGSHLPKGFKVQLQTPAVQTPAAGSGGQTAALWATPFSAGPTARKTLTGPALTSSPPTPSVKRKAAGKAAGKAAANGGNGKAATLSAAQAASPAVAASVGSGKAATPSAGQAVGPAAQAAGKKRARGAPADIDQEASKQGGTPGKRHKPVEVAGASPQAAAAQPRKKRSGKGVQAAHVAERPAAASEGEKAHQSVVTGGNNGKEPQSQNVPALEEVQATKPKIQKRKAAEAKSKAPIAQVQPDQVAKRPRGGKPAAPEGMILPTPEKAASGKAGKRAAGESVSMLQLFEDEPQKEATPAKSTPKPQGKNSGAALPAARKGGRNAATMSSSAPEVSENQSMVQMVGQKRGLKGKGKASIRALGKRGVVEETAKEGDVPPAAKRTRTAAAKDSKRSSSKG